MQDKRLTEVSFNYCPLKCVRPDCKLLISVIVFLVIIPPVGYFLLNFYLYVYKFVSDCNVWKELDKMMRHGAQARL